MYFFLEYFYVMMNKDILLTKLNLGWRDINRTESFYPIEYVRSNMCLLHNQAEIIKKNCFTR